MLWLCFSHSSYLNQKSFRSSLFIYLVQNWEHQKREKKKVYCTGSETSPVFSADFVFLLRIAHLHAHTCPFPVAEVCPAEEVCCLQDRGPQCVHGAVREGKTLPSSGAWCSQHAFNSFSEVSAWKTLYAKLSFHSCFNNVLVNKSWLKIPPFFFLSIFLWTPWTIKKPKPNKIQNQRKNKNYRMLSQI